MYHASKRIQHLCTRYIMANRYRQRGEEGERERAREEKREMEGERERAREEKRELEGERERAREEKRELEGERDMYIYMYYILLRRRRAWQLSAVFLPLSLFRDSANTANYGWTLYASCWPTRANLGRLIGRYIGTTCACASAYGRRDAPSLVGLDLSVSCVRDACRPYESPSCKINHS